MSENQRQIQSIVQGGRQEAEHFGSFEPDRYTGQGHRSLEGGAFSPVNERMRVNPVRRGMSHGRGGGVKNKRAVGSHKELHRDYGKIPSYLQEYKAKRVLADKKKAVEEEKSHWPAGTRLLSDKERLETLEHIKRKRSELNFELERLPLGNQTMKMDRRRKDLERHLNDIDRTILTFSKDKVFIKVDE